MNAVNKQAAENILAQLRPLARAVEQERDAINRDTDEGEDKFEAEDANLDLVNCAVSDLETAIADPQ